jgi:hypothetical protein
MTADHDNARRFLTKLEARLGGLPPPAEMAAWVRATTRDARGCKSTPHLRQPEAAFLNGQVIPVVHDAVVAEGLSPADATRALLNEYYRNVPECSGTPARTRRHPFNKIAGASPAEVYRRWSAKRGGLALVQSCPDFALRDPFPHAIVFEGKYYRQGSLQYAQQELVRDIYQAFFYRGLPHLAETPAGRASWKYDYACLVAYDASPGGTLRKAWKDLPSRVRKGLWDGANVYVMILGGGGMEQHPAYPAAKASPPATSP